jgi:hypothetical protein
VARLLFQIGVTKLPQTLDHLYVFQQPPRMKFYKPSFWMATKTLGHRDSAIGGMINTLVCLVHESQRNPEHDPIGRLVSCCHTRQSSLIQAFGKTRSCHGSWQAF